MRLPSLVTLSLVALIALPSAPVSAHGRFPEAGLIVFHPSDPDTIVLRTTFGLVVSTDGGGSWRWVCQPVVGARLTEDPSVVITGDGSLLVSLFDGLSRGTAGGCTWDFPDPDVTDSVMIDVAAHPDDSASAFVLSSNGGVPNLVYSTTDHGATWDATGPEIDAILFETIRVAPSDASRLYLSGAVPPGGETAARYFVHRSSDGGATWESFPFALNEGERNIFLLGVDPTDPDRLLMRVRSEADDRMVLSEDGGETFRDALTLWEIRGFAWSDDGQTIYVGGNEGSDLHRSDDGGATFEEVSSLQIGCLALRGSEVWACADNFIDGFSIGRSADGGETFEPVFVLQDIEGIVECDDGADAPEVCGSELPDLIFDLGLPLDAGVARPDGGAPWWLDGGTSGMDAGPGTGDDPGCGCSAPGGRRGGGLPLTLTLAALAIWRTRRRRPSPGVAEDPQ